MMAAFRRSLGRGSPPPRSLPAALESSSSAAASADLADRRAHG
jgi:hypothetical protein